MTQVEDQASSEERSDKESDMCTPLTYGYEELLKKAIHESTFNGIWKNASALLNTEGMILPVLGNASTLHDRMVASKLYVFLPISLYT